MTCGRKLGDHREHGARPGLRSRLGSRTVEGWKAGLEVGWGTRMKLWHLAEYDVQCGPLWCVSRRRVLLSIQGGLAWWSGLSVFTCA